jgi:hypothetical protein
MSDDAFPALGMRDNDAFIAGISTTMRLFPNNRPDDVRRVCHDVLQLWRPLLERAERIDIGMMIGNGEQIYRWTGNLDDEFEWDHYKGHNNPEHAGYGFRPIPLRPFREDWFHFTYGDLREIIRLFREAAYEMYAVPIDVSTLAEPGPEFCESLFRYEWHPEIISYMGSGHGNSIDYRAVLHADARTYGAYPNGIPEGEPFARFLGKQVADFCRVMDIQAINFSNGLGFGTYPWKLVGRNFDGEAFGLTDTRALAQEILDFWVTYKREAPDLPVSAQGSNWPVGVDLAAKGVPLQDLYDRRLLDIPLGYTVSVFFDDSVGFAMASKMSRIAHAPWTSLSFYLHDPWYPQNPWEDFPYDHKAFDLYAPASIGHVAPDGVLTQLRGFGTLVHDENADLQPKTFRSLWPHVEDALDRQPDQIGPLTWLYPFQTYHRLVLDRQERANQVWFEDAFTAKAIDGSLPLNNVIQADALATAMAKGTLGDPATDEATILYTPTPVEGASYANALLAWIEDGGRVLFYGPTSNADPRVLELLGLVLDEPLSGELSLRWNEDVLPPDDPVGTRILLHDQVLSGGGLAATLAPGINRCNVVATASSADGLERVYAVTTADQRVAWVRGSLPFRLEQHERIAYHDASRYVNAARFPRYLLRLMGYTLSHNLLDVSQRNPQMFISRHRNAWILSGYKPDNTVTFGLRFPDGAPILTGDETQIIDGVARYHLDKSFRNECRVLVQQEEGIVGCRKTLNHEFTESELAVSGLQNATVTLYLPMEKLAEAYVRMQGAENQPGGAIDSSGHAAGPGAFNVEAHRQGSKIVLPNLTGTLLVRW